MKECQYSVALCTYNGEKYIVQQLESILQQSVKPTQIVISDDGSSDSTLTLVSRFLINSNVDYLILENKGDHGVAHNFQNAIKNCRCPIIFTSDQDDVWLNNKAELMLNVFEINPSAQLVFSDGELVDSNLNLLGSTVWESVGITPKRISEGKWFHYLLKNCLITGAAMAFRKELFASVNIIPKEWLHDGWLAWAAVINNGLFPCPFKLFYYRQHTDNQIGMVPIHNYYGHFREWLKNFDEMIEHREIRYRRYQSLYDMWKNRFSLKQQEELYDCIYFWKTLCEMKNKGKTDQFHTIFTLFKKGYYHKYFVGSRGALRDILLLFKK